MAFEELGYASAAMDSYRTFARLKRDGVIPPGCRFLVSLPTPIAPVSAFVALEYQSELEPVYEAQMRIEVEHILAAIPADQLAIQWDARYEFAMLEGAIAVWFEDVRSGVVERLLRLARMVPSAVELGFHLCYGDDEHGHFAEPADAGKLVGVANALAATLDRPLNWIHMPVPQERDDDGYYAPLGELRLSGETELYLGLIHAGDQGDGARRRIAAARHHVEHFGIATECGWGRGGAAAVAGLLGSARRAERTAARRARPAAGRERLRVAGGLRPRPRRGLDQPRRRRGGHRLRPRRRARLVPQPRHDGRGSRAHAARRRPAARLLRRHRHPARPPAPARVRPPGRRRDRRRVREVPARRAREVPRRSAGGAAAAALPQGRAATAAARRGARHRVRRARLHERDPPLPRPRGDARHLDGRAAPRRRRVHQLGQHPQPAREARRVDPRRDGVGDQRPRRGARALRPAVRALPRGGRRRRADEGPRRVPRPGVRGAAPARLLPAGADRRRASRCSTCARRRSRRV